MNENFIDTTKNDIQSLCAKLSFSYRYEQEFFYDYLKLVPTNTSPFQLVMIQNLLLNGIVLLKYFPNEYATPERQQINQVERINEIELRLLELEPLLNEAVDYYVKASDKTYDEYFSQLALIHRSIERGVRAKNYLSSISTSFTTKPHRMPNTINYKLAFVLFKKAFDLLSRNTKNYIQPDQSIIHLLNEDSNHLRRKLDPNIFIVSLMSLIGMPLTERTIRNNLKLKHESLLAELENTSGNRFESIDSLLSSLMANRPNELFQPDELLENSIHEMRKSSLVIKSKFEKLCEPTRNK